MRKLMKSIFLFGLLLGGTSAFALDGIEPDHKVVIQISSGDIQTQTLALNNAVNLQKAYGMDQVDIKVVAYGPGLSVLTKQGELSERVESLAMQNIGFNACSNTIAKIEAKTGSKPVLANGVEIVPGGVSHIMELQEKGYAYLRP